MGDRRRSRSDLPKGAPAFVDDANRGRRTGKLIPTAPLDEDGFESIETLFGSQAYSVSAPKQRPRKQQAALTPVAERSYGDDDGSDMDITEVQDNQMDDMDDYNLPEAPAPAPLHRRPIPRRSSPGVDHVPSPRGPQYYSQTSSQSTRQAKAPRNSAIHRSHSSQRSSSPIEPEPEITSSRKSLARRSTMGGNHSVDMDVDEDSYQAPDPGLGEEELDVGSPPPPLPSPSPVPSPPKPKRKPRDVTPPQPVDDDMEDDIAAGLAEVNDGPPNSDSEPEEPPPRPKSEKENGKEAKTAKDKGKGKEKAPPKRTRPDEDEEPSKSPKKPRPKPKKENAGAKAVVQTVGGKRKKRDFNAATPPNVRRSQRERFSPLEWWRNEKFVYGRSPDPEEGPLLVPLIRAIERPPKPPPVALSKKKGGRRTVKVKKEEDDGALRLDGDGVFGAPRTAEDGMDEDTEELGVVLDYATGREVERRIAFPGARVEFTPTEGPFHFQKIFGDSDFFAAGVMKIPVGGRKPNKPSKENTFVFYCVSGGVEVKVHKSTFVIAPGGMFLAPRGNSYTIANVSQRDAYIFFAQSRKVLDDSDEPPPLPQPRESLGGSKPKAKVVQKKS